MKKSNLGYKWWVEKEGKRPHKKDHTYMYSDHDYDYFCDDNHNHDVFMGPLDPLVRIRRIDL